MSLHQIQTKIIGWSWLIMAILIGLFVAGSAPLKYTEDRVPSSVNPLFADDMYGIRITELIFEGMIGWDKQQRPAPQLATSWTIAKDLLSITLDLRRDVKWHDGAPFTSNDVAFTVNAMTNTRSQITDRYLAQIIKGVQIINPHRVTISFKRPINEPLRWMQFKILPAHRFIKQGRTQLPQRSDYFNQRPYGTGPFRLDRWSGKKIIMQRFPEHWRGSKITLNGVILQANPDKDIQREVMRYGGFDAIVRVMPKDILLFERDRNTRLYPYSTNDWWYIAFNHKQGSILRDKRVREALLLALDRDSLRAAHLGDGQVISGPFSPNDPLYNFEVPARGQDLEQANKLFDASGWRKKPGQTYRSKDGKNLQFRFYVPHSRTSYKSLCLAMQGEWQKVGVKIDIVWMDDAKWNQTVFDKKDFDLVLHVWNFDDLSTIYPLFHSKGIRNYIGYQNPEIDRLLTAANNTTDPAIYQAIYRKIHQILNGELPYLFLWSLTNYSAISARVRQVVIHPFNYFHYAYGWSKQ